MRCLLFVCLVAVVVCGEKAKLRTPENGNGSPKCANQGVRRKLPNIARTGGLTTLANLVEALSLTSALNRDGPFTVFAPTNAAFANSGLLADATITAAQATHILLHHVVAGNLLSEAVLQGPLPKTVTLTTLAGTTLNVHVTAAGVVTLDDYATVVQVDVKACNGVAHVIDHVLIPPCGHADSLPTIAERATTAPYAPLFTTLASIVSVDEQEAILNAISSPGALTLFAPINEAFAAISETLGTLTQAQVTQVLQYHALGRRVIASDIPEGTSSAVTLLTQSVQLNRSMTGVTVKGTGNSEASNVIAANVQACNGVIHAIDQVLIPAL